MNMDGTCIISAHYINTDTENEFYDGYTYEVEVKNMLLFSFDGCMIHAAFNFPGSWLDRRI